MEFETDDLIKNPTFILKVMSKEMEKEIRESEHIENVAGPFPDEYYIDMKFDKQRLKVINLAWQRLEKIDRMHDKAVG